MEHDAGRAGGLDTVSRALRHHVLIVALALLVGAGLGAVLGLAQGSSYTSTTSVLVNPTEGNAYSPSGRNDQLTSLETEAQLVRSDDVLTSAADRTPYDDSSAGLESQLQVIVPTNTQILEIAFTAGDPEVARDTAQAIAESYLEVRRERAEEVLTEQLETIDAQTEEVIANLRRATAASQTGSDQSRAFQARLADALSSELVSLRTQRTAVESTPPQPGSIYSPASLPSSGGPLLLVAMILAGALVGLAAGLSLALLRERRLGLVRAPGDVVAAGLPVLATLPRLTTSARAKGSAAGNRALDEAVGRLRSFVLAAGSRPTSVCVHAGADAAGAAGLATTLAASLARAGYSVVVVDAGVPRSPTKDKGAPRARGFTDLLGRPRQDADSLLVPCSEPRLSMLPAGTSGPGEEDLFVPERLTAVLDLLQRHHDFVLVQAPDPASARGQAVALACSVVVVAVRVDATTVADLRQVADGPGRADGAVGAAVVQARGPVAKLTDPCDASAIAGPTQASRLGLRTDVAGEAGRTAPRA